MKIYKTEQELLELKDRIPKMGGAGESYGLAREIPQLVDELLLLRKYKQNVESLIERLEYGY